MLEFAGLSVIVAININSFTCGVMEIVAYGLAFLLFFVFNVLRKYEKKKDN